MNRKLLCRLAAAASCVILFAFGRADAATPISACGYTINTPGPYVLTANLSNVGKSAPCITVNADEVTIDLAGYTISGSNNSYYGINGINVAADLTVRNGTIRYFQVGVYANSTGVRLGDLNLIGNALQGAVLADDAQVSGCLFRSNGADGLDVGPAAVVTNSRFNSNQASGLVAGSAASVIGCGAASNGVDGIVTAGTVENNFSSSNRRYGFSDSGRRTTYRGNTASGNYAGFTVGSAATFVGNSAARNSDGFEDDGSSTYQGNTTEGNGGEGFLGGPSDTYTGNTADNNGSNGFSVRCPDNLIANTALGNGLNQFRSTGGCNLVNNLF